jgi:pentatricopeptide repeat protein
MERSGVTPATATLVTAVTACSRAENLSLGGKIHGYMNEVFRLSIPLANALVYMYTKNGCLQEAVKLFEQMPERNIICWTILVSGHYLAGQLDKAKALFYQSTEKDVILWTAMIEMCSKCEHVDKALRVFE